MNTILLIIGVWAFFMIVLLCFEDCRVFLKDAREFLIPEWKPMYKEAKEQYGTSLACLLILFVALIFPFWYLLFFSLFPVLSLCGIFRRFRSNDVNDVDDTWLRKQKEMEEEYQRKSDRFKIFSYSGKVPFDFDANTYIYVENRYDEDLNRCIQENLDKIEDVFHQNGFRFIYLPQWKPDTSLNCLAGLTEEENEKVKGFLNSINTVEYTRLLCDVLHFDMAEMESGIFHFACFMYGSEPDRWSIVESTRFTLYPMQGVTADGWETFFLDYCAYIKEDRKRPHGGLYMSVVPTLRGGELHESLGNPQQEFADYEFPIVMKNIAENIKKEIEALKGAGYYELLLHTLGAEMLDELKNIKMTPKLSRLQITDEFKIRLLDYDKEVRMTPLQKTLYIFYLRHPEGVEFKMLSAYYNELLAIYKVFSNREDDEKQKDSIRRLVDVTDNAINEKCSRIKEAFLKVADDFIARNYYIVLDRIQYRGEGDKKSYVYEELLKKIVLPRSLVIYPKEIVDIEVLAPEGRKNAIKEELEEMNEQYIALHRLFFDKSCPKGKLVEKYTEFINRNPKYYAAYCDRAILYTHIGRYYEAVVDNQLLIAHNERVWSDAIINKAEALFFLKDYNEALKVANHYFEIGEEPTAECYRIRAEIFKALKMRDEYKADMRDYRRLRKVENNKY